jgi:hypothetical protein
MTMKTFGVKNLTAMAGLVFAMVIVSASDISAQSRRDNERERERIERLQQNNARQNRRGNRGRSRSSSENPNRAAVNAALYQGYQQGLIAGQSDRSARKYNRFNVYRNSGSAPNGGDPTAWDYLYRQGYLEGYEDGYRGRIRY